MKDDLTTRRRPPENEADWLYIWDSSAKTQKLWIIGGPIYAIVIYRKAFLALAGIILALNSPRIIAAIEALIQ